MFANNFVIIFSDCLEPIKWRELCVPVCIAARANSRKTVSFREELWLPRCRKYMWYGWRWMPWSGPSKYRTRFASACVGVSRMKYFFLRVFGHSVARVCFGGMSNKERRACFFVCAILYCY